MGTTFGRGHTELLSKNRAGYRIIESDWFAPASYLHKRAMLLKNSDLCLAFESLGGQLPSRACYDSQPEMLLSSTKPVSFLKLRAKRTTWHSSSTHPYHSGK